MRQMMTQTTHRATTWPCRTKGHTRPHQQQRVDTSHPQANMACTAWARRSPQLPQSHTHYHPRKPEGAVEKSKMSSCDMDIHAETRCVLLSSIYFTMLHLVGGLRTSTTYMIHGCCDLCFYSCKQDFIDFLP